MLTVFVGFPNVVGVRLSDEGDIHDIVTTTEKEHSILHFNHDGEKHERVLDMVKLSTLGLTIDDLKKVLPKGMTILTH